jgi:NAD(P)H-nitrite reductase large subunit
VKSGEEPRLAYNRVLLSSVLAGEVRASDISLKPAAWWNAEVAAHAGIAVNRDIVVDDHLVTSASDVFENGKCAEDRGVCYGLVEPANEQARAGRAPRRQRCAQPSAARTTHARSAEHAADVSGMTRQRRAKWL